MNRGRAPTPPEATTRPFRLDARDILGSGDHAVGLYRMGATRGDDTLEWDHVNVYRLRDGKVTEVWLHPYDFEAFNAFWS